MYVVFPKRTRLGRCDLCASLSDQRTKATNSAERDIIEKRMNNHTELHKAERTAYQKRCRDSERCPDLSWSLILDMSDKFIFPHRVCLDLLMVYTPSCHVTNL